jgi:hypothetical protein
MLSPPHRKRNKQIVTSMKKSKSLAGLVGRSFHFTHDSKVITGMVVSKVGSMFLVESSAEAGQRLLSLADFRALGFIFEKE